MTESLPAENDSSRRARHRKRGGAGLTALWVTGAAAAIIVALGVSGTLSAWTSAIITNDTNTVATANAVILKEVGPGGTPVTCLSSDGGVANSYTCSGINKYGGTGTPMAPGGTQTVAVTMSNVGSTSGTLTLKANGCTTTGGLTTGALNACGIVQVAVACPTPTATVPATTLTAFGSAAAATVGTLAPGASVTCTFTVTLPATASPVYAAQTLSQPLVWTLS